MVIVLGWASAAWAAPPAPLTTLRDVRALSNEQARLHQTVAFEATVTYFRGSSPIQLYVQDGDVGIYVFLTKEVRLVPGDRVLVRGTLHPSFRPLVKSEDVTVLGHVGMPKSASASYSGLVHLQYLCRLVTVHAVVRTADLISSQNVRITYLHMITDEGYIDADVLNIDASVLKGLLDAEVEVTGVASATYDNKMQRTGVLLHVNTMAGVKVLKRAGASPWALPVTPMDTILTDYRVRDLTARVRVHGTVTYYQPGTAVVLQNGGRSLWIETQTNAPLRIGDLADATGFPDVHGGFLSLVRGELLDSGNYAPMAPQPANWESLSSSNNVIFGHIYDLVSIEGQVVTEARQAVRDEYVLNSNGRLFTAIYYHSDKLNLNLLPPMKQIPIGSTVRITGICGQQSSNPFNGPVPFDILLRSFDDIEVVGNPSLLNVRNLMIFIGLLLAVVVFVGARGWALERKVRRQTAALAARTEAEADLERRRSRILEDINGSDIP